MFVIKNGEKLLEGTQGIQFSSEQRAVDYLFDNKFYLCKGYLDGEIREFWQNHHNSIREIQIIKINSEDDIIKEVSNLLSRNWIYPEINTDQNRMYITDTNGDRFVLTCDKT